MQRPGSDITLRLNQTISYIFLDGNEVIIKEMLSMCLTAAIRDMTD